MFCFISLLHTSYSEIASHKTSGPLADTISDEMFTQDESMTTRETTTITDNLEISSTVSSEPQTGSHIQDLTDHTIPDVMSYTDPVSMTTENPEMMTATGDTVTDIATPDNLDLVDDVTISPEMTTPSPESDSDNDVTTDNILSNTETIYDEMTTPSPELESEIEITTDNILSNTDTIQDEMTTPSPELESEIEMTTDNILSNTQTIQDEMTTLSPESDSGNDVTTDNVLISTETSHDEHMTQNTDLDNPFSTEAAGAPMKVTPETITDESDIVTQNPTMAVHTDSDDTGVDDTTDVPHTTEVPNDYDVITDSPVTLTKESFSVYPTDISDITSQNNEQTTSMAIDTDLPDITTHLATSMETSPASITTTSEGVTTSGRIELHMGRLIFEPNMFLSMYAV